MLSGISDTGNSSSKRKRLNSELQTLRLPKKTYQQSSLSSSTEEYRQPDVPSDLAISPVTTQLQGAHGFSISGNPSFTNIGIGVNNVNNYGGTQGLEKLETFVSFSARHNSAEQDPECQCHPGTREVVLGRIRNWIDDPNASEHIFWLYGPAGAGKSAIAHTIARSYSQEQIAATFFFYRSDPGRNNGNRLFTTLSWQLAFSIPALKSFIIDALDKQPDLPRTNVETQFDQLIVQPFRVLGNNITQPPHTPPVIIIDGVDECADEKLRQRFLKAIGNAVGDGHLPLRFLICSRPEVDIKGIIDRFQPPPLLVDLAELNDANHDIEKYLRDEFSRIASEQDLDPTLWPGQPTIQEFVFKSSGYFIFAATVIRVVGDPDNDAEAQLDIIRGLKPIGSTSPFAQLDGLYTEILSRQHDQDFVKTFLALLVGRSSVKIQIPWVSITDLAEDDAMLMKVSEKELRIKLRRMHSLLKFEPHIVIHHRSFLDFLLEPSRSDQYHVSREGGTKRYLELMVDSIVQYAATVIEQPDHHKTNHFRPQFVNILDEYPSALELPIEEWQSALQPLMHLQDNLLGLPHCNSTWDILACNQCLLRHTMRCLSLHLAIYQGFSHATAFTLVKKGHFIDDFAEKPISNAPLTAMERDVPEMDLNHSLSSLLIQWLQKSESVESSSNVQTLSLLRALLRFNYAEVAMRVFSVADAQDLVDIIDHVINDEYLLGQLKPCEISEATHLVLTLFEKVPLIPRSLFLEADLDSPVHIYLTQNESIEYLIHAAFMGRILDHNYIVPVSRICKEHSCSCLIVTGMNDNDESIRQWRKRVNPSPVARLKTMLAVARAIQYVHSLGIVLEYYRVSLDDIFLDPDFHAKILFCGLTFPAIRGMLLGSKERWTFEANVFSFGCFFYELYFDVEIMYEDRYFFSRGTIVERPSKPEIRDDAWQLIQRCCAEDQESRPTMDKVVEEMESWKLG